MKEKVVVIVGATSMIGKACAKLLAQQGMNLMLVARDSNKLDNLVKNLTGKIKYNVTDLNTPTVMQSIVDNTLDCFQRIDALIINVAIYPYQSIEALTLSEWNQTLNLNLTTPFMATKACVPIMKKQKSGNIIFISSIAGETIGLPQMSAYATSKAGINGLMRTAALELAPYNINVNSISPGKMYDANTLTENELTTKLAPIPLRRFIEPQDIAHMALFLLSKQANNITGQNFIIDGGQSIMGENSHVQT